jgi:DNA-binding NtrC family response regulator
VILLVSSDPACRYDWEASLDEAGHAVVLTTTAAGAVQQLFAGGVDVVVAEYEVAGGLDLLTIGLARVPDPPPLVLLSGAADAPAVSARLGAAAFVMKPCSGKELAAVVTRQTETPIPMERAPTGPIERW